MTTYEIMLLLDPEQAEARQEEILARSRELVEQAGGTWHSHDAWGRRRLAYPIAHKEEGVYHLVVFDADAPTLDEISRVLKIDDAVLRHLATRHIAGSRTSAPRDDAAAETTEAAAIPAETTEAESIEAEPVEAETAVSDEAEPEYADADEEPGEDSGEPGEDSGEEEE